jgi:hypothetical protein
MRSSATVCNLFATTCLTWLLAHPAAAASDCLDKLESRPQDAAFDKQHDLDSSGSSFSCDAYVRASQARDILAAFRFGTLNNSLPHIKRSIRFPLTVKLMPANQPVKRITIHDASAWLKFKSAHLDKSHLALIECSTLDNVSVMRKWNGFFYGGGRFWFFNTADSGLRLGQVNVTPIDAALLRQYCNR